MCGNQKKEIQTMFFGEINNNIIIKDLFSQILLHIHNHITSMLPIPICLDQPFIVYHAVKNINTPSGILIHYS